MKILAEPRRVLPITFHPEILRRMISGRVRVIHQAGPRFAKIESGDALWIREGMHIPEQHHSGDWLSVVYGGDGTQKSIRWPKVIARPFASNVPPNGMPVHASRLTLLVTSVREMRLQQISDASAVLAGVDFDIGGFSNPLRHNQVFDHAVDAFGRMWDCAHHYAPQNGPCFSSNPEVIEIAFRAVASNVAELVPGLGYGGVR